LAAVMDLMLEQVQQQPVHPLVLHPGPAVHRDDPSEAGRERACRAFARTGRRVSLDMAEAPEGLLVVYFQPCGNPNFERRWWSGGSS
jgi:hypothetical protein